MNPAIPRPTASRRRLCALALLLASATQAMVAEKPRKEMAMPGGGHGGSGMGGMGDMDF